MSNRVSIISPMNGKPHGYYALKPGTVATVKHCFGGYRLPEGLRPWNRVMIKSFDHGYYKVERLGKEFTIFQTNIRDRELQAIQRNERA
jgi:hypothetical protein